MKSSFLPHWHWDKGLHDARIIIKQVYLETSEEDSFSSFHRNYVRIELDTSDALFDSSVKSIDFFNYKELSDDNELEGWWWISDDLSFDGQKYLLQIELISELRRKVYAIRFTDCRVIALEPK